jgi:hypothetical protein
MIQPTLVQVYTIARSNKNLRSIPRVSIPRGLNWKLRFEEETAQMIA